MYSFLCSQALVQCGVCRSHLINTCGLTEEIWENGEIREVESLTQLVRRTKACRRTLPSGTSILYLEAVSSELDRG